MAANKGATVHLQSEDTDARTVAEDGSPTNRQAELLWSQPQLTSIPGNQGHHRTCLLSSLVLLQGDCVPGLAVCVPAVHLCLCSTSKYVKTYMTHSKADAVKPTSRAVFQED